MERFLQRLVSIFRAIDTAYNEARRFYSFSCDGCTDNCCVTKFHHHTIIEELFLAKGLKMLGAERLGNVINRAEEVVRIHASQEDVQVMCPLNEEGLCIIYEYRPMICRIHGLPYELRKMDMSFEYGDGCYRFITEKKDIRKDFRINRTAFYLDLAVLEKEVRRELNFNGRYKKTTAEMVLSIIHGKDFKKDQS